MERQGEAQAEVGGVLFLAPPIDGHGLFMCGGIPEGVPQQHRADRRQGLPVRRRRELLQGLPAGVSGGQLPPQCASPRIVRVEPACQLAEPHGLLGVERVRLLGKATP